MKKPDAITSIEESEWKQKVWPLRVSELLFCGRSTTKKLEQVGIYTIGDLAEMDHDYVNQLLGKNGLMLWSYANGLDDSPVMEKDFVSPMKSVGHGITCTADLEGYSGIMPGHRTSIKDSWIESTGGSDSDSQSGTIYKAVSRSTFPSDDSAFGNC